MGTVWRCARSCPPTLPHHLEPRVTPQGDPQWPLLLSFLPPGEEAPESKVLSRRVAPNGVTSSQKDQSGSG
jgi:hypothetical protein